MPNYAAVQTKKDELIRKALAGSVFIGSSSAPVVTALTGTDSTLAVLPGTNAYTDGGNFTDEGARFSRAVERSEVTSFGSYNPTRTDITSDAETFAIDFQETNKQTISMFTGADPASLVPTVASGELKIVKPDRPSPRTYRVLALSVDGPTESEIYIARFYPRVKVSDFSDQAYAKDGVIQWGATFAAEKDSTVGSSLVYFFGGPGWKALLTQMGFASS